MVKATLIAALTLGCVFGAKAQVDTRDARENWIRTPATSTNDMATKHQKEGDVNFYMDKRIERLDSLKRLNPTGMEGYRVQIFFGDRNEAQAKRIAFLRDYPDVGAYISYLAPNFRVRVGDFRTKMESEKFKTEISQGYKGTYIVKDQIAFPQLGVQSED